MDATIRDTLRELIESRGIELAGNLQQLRGLLSDRHPTLKQERNLLLAAAEDGIPQQLLASERPSETHLRRLVSRLQRDRRIDEDAAAWAVETWAHAVGRTVSGGYAPPVVVAGEGEETLSNDDTWSGPVGKRAPGRSLILGLGVAGLLLVAVVGVLTFDGDSPEPSSPPITANPSERATATPRPTTTARPTAPVTAAPAITPEITPTPTDRDLLSWVPIEIRDTCQATTLPSAYASYREAVTCVASGIDALWYVGYETVDEVYGVYYDGLQFSDYADSGSCPDDAPSDETWHFTSDPDVSHGRLGCFIGGETASVVWTIDYAAVLAYAIRGDDDLVSLFDAWRNLGNVPPD